MATTGYCNSSSLAIISSIVGILTFALTLILSCITFFAFTFGALEEIESLSQNGESIRAQLIPILGYIDSRQEENEFSHANSSYEKRTGTRELENLEVSTRLLVAGLKSLSTELEELQADWQLRRRLRWVYKRTHFIEKMRQLSRQQAQISAEQLTLILRYLSCYRKVAVPLHWHGF